MPTIFSNFQSGTLTDNPLTSGATSVNSAAFANLPVVAATDTMWLALDPTGANGAPEIVQVTVHTSSATVLTVVRAQQGTTARAHPVGTQWVASATKAEMDELPFRKMTTRGDMLAATGANVAGRLAVGAANTVLTSNGTDPSWGSVTSAMITDGTIVNADVSASAAIAYSKLNLANSIVTGDIVDGTIALADLATAVQNLMVPAGTVALSIAAAAPTGWLFHNQTSVGAQTAFPALWAVAPASWKSGANLVIPNLADRALMQAGTTALGATGGSQSLTIAAGNLPAHAHGPGTLAPSPHSVSDPTHVHQQYVVFTNGGAAASTRADYDTDTSTPNVLPQVNTGAAATGITVGNHTMSGSTDNGPGTGTAMTVPLTPHAAFNVMIKAH
jgi:hypothetical protein